MSLVKFLWKLIPHKHVFESERGGKLFGLDLYRLECRCGEPMFRSAK